MGGAPSFFGDDAVVIRHVPSTLSQQILGRHTCILLPCEPYLKYSRTKGCIIVQKQSKRLDSQADNESPSEDMSDVTTTTSSDDAKIRHVNVYQLYTPRQRALILLAGAFLAILTPFTDTIYLPALKSVAEDYDASDSIVALTVSIYLACVGVGQLLWGPLSDR